MSKIVERTLDFLELFADRKQPLLLSDISKILAIPASSCHDVLQALVQRGYIYELAPRAGYYPTLRLFDVAKAIADNDPVVRRAEHTLRALKDVVGETVLLSKTSGTKSTYLLAFEPAHRLRFTVSLGDSFSSLYATSGGKAQLSCWSDAALEAHLKDVKLAQFTSKTDYIYTDLARRNPRRPRAWLVSQQRGKHRGCSYNFCAILVERRRLHCDHRWPDSPLGAEAGSRRGRASSSLPVFRKALNGAIIGSVFPPAVLGPDCQ